ncbi:MAG: type I-E CRISPR-associated protein Cas6/Cse3/CasE, partial [Ruminococcus sp.]|nr:type I-E CRISPR-associated protein Cas6/Cse3/CasE [Ruminococcus sp.]
MKALASPSIFHGAVSSSFSGKRPEVLWRIDSLNGDLYMLILSQNKPELENFCEQFSKQSCGETRDYDILLD